MSTLNKLQNPLAQSLFGHFQEIEAILNKEGHPAVSRSRKQAFDYFLEIGLPTHNSEKWRNTKLDKQYSSNYKLNVEPSKYEKSVSEIFRCEIHGFDAKVKSMLNGWYYCPDDSKLQTDKDGVVTGSMLSAQKAFPDLFEKHFGRAVNFNKNGFAAICSALFRDGLFIYVPKNVEVKTTIQLIKMVNMPENPLLNSRNLIILEEGSKLSFMHCDDSVNHKSSLINTVTEIIVGKNACLDLYKLQNINDETTLINNTFIRQDRDSNSNVNVLTLNGGMIRNEIYVDLAGEGANADINGVYLMDKKQHIDNQVTLRHSMPNCTSNELFKGVLDNESRAVFNGYIYVAKDAQKTSAFQRNNNILISADAQIDTMPFLEIYADDVKCSHGATVGQLDEDAMFYMMQRGISKEDARLLLMYAFTSEVTSKLNIETLRVSIEDMIKKRLRGELSICEKCVLHCSVPDKLIEFEIDMSKV
jgi:Fe-S cluster assembly protein SufD